MLARVLALWLALSPALAFAQSAVLNGFPPGTFQSRAALNGSGGGGGYVGPGDTNGSAVYFHGFIAYNAAYATAGSKAANLCDAATATTCQDFNVLTNGKFDVASATTFCTAHTSCVVNKLYDQTGGGNDIITPGGASPTASPPMVFSAFGSCPGASFTSATTRLEGGSTITQALPLSMAVVAERTSNFTSLGQIMGTVGAAPGFFFKGSANTVQLFNGGGLSAGATATDSVPHALQALFDATGSAGSIGVDGTTTGSQAPGTGSFNDRADFNNASFNFTGTGLYDGLWAGDKSANNATLSTNVHSLCGF